MTVGYDDRHQEPDLLMLFIVFILCIGPLYRELSTLVLDIHAGAPPAVTPAAQPLWLVLGIALAFALLLAPVTIPIAMMLTIWATVRRQCPLWIKVTDWVITMLAALYVLGVVKSR